MIFGLRLIETMAEEFDSQQVYAIKMQVGGRRMPDPGTSKIMSPASSISCRSVRPRRVAPPACAHDRGGLRLLGAGHGEKDAAIPHSSSCVGS